MGELGEPGWAVISERGCEASGLKHEEAVKLMHRLVGQKVHGTCVVTNEAARHLAPVQKVETPTTTTAPRPVKTHI
jgi:hypothetical protein